MTYRLPAGDYAIELHSGDTVLRCETFAVSFESEYSAHGDEPPGDPNPTPKMDVSFIVPWEDGTTSVALLHNNEVLDQRAVSPNAPRVVITGYTAKVLVSWAAAGLTGLQMLGMLLGKERATMVQPMSRAQRRAVFIEKEDPLVELHDHSYQAGLWDANAIAWHQYTEGVRRGLDRSPRLSSVNDGALWMERIPFTNFPNAQQIVDWTHAVQRLWQVAEAVFGRRTSQKEQWMVGAVSTAGIKEG